MHYGSWHTLAIDIEQSERRIKLASQGSVDPELQMTGADI